VALGGLSSVNHLLLADDNVTIAESKMGLQKKIDALSDYCVENFLSINLSKTKVIVFRNGGKLLNSWKWQLKGEQIEVVPEYTYLGVKFSASGSFRSAGKEMKRKAIATIGPALKMLSLSRTDSWESRIKILDSVVIPTMTYASEVLLPTHSEWKQEESKSTSELSSGH
ncbi:unnamed protein product, partial [Allacma fusca]